jgi:hypothetical protein
MGVMMSSTVLAPSSRTDPMMVTSSSLRLSDPTSMRSQEQNVNRSKHTTVQDETAHGDGVIRIA